VVGERYTLISAPLVELWMQGEVQITQWALQVKHQHDPGRKHSSYEFVIRVEVQ